MAHARDTPRLSGMAAFVSGAGSGFGAAIALRLAQEGAKVTCADVNADAATDTAREIAGAGGKAQAAPCDVGDGAATAASVAAAIGHWNGLDIVVNNAGIRQDPKHFTAITEVEIDRLFTVNVKSIYHTTAAALDALRRSSCGCIVNIASATALRPRPGMAWYNATKAAIASLTQSMALEYAKFGLRVNAVAPSLGRTGMLAGLVDESDPVRLREILDTIPLGRLAEARDIAGAVAFLASREAAFVTGIILPVDGGRSAS